MHSHAKSAQWFLDVMNTDENKLKARDGAFEALQKLKKESVAVVYRIRGDSIDYLAGIQIGGFKINPRSSRRAMLQVIRKFYRSYFRLFVSSKVKYRDLKIEKVKSGGRTVVKIQQYVNGIRLLDKRWTIVFDKKGYLSRVSARPVDPSTITVSLKPKIKEKSALKKIMEADELIFPERKTRKEDKFDIELCLLGKENQLIWSVDYRNSGKINVFRRYIIDAHRGQVTRIQDMCSHGLKSIPVRHYSHPNGVKDSSASIKNSNINVDTLELKIGSATADVFTMQRLGSGRARVWNAKPAGTDTTPLFSRSISFLDDYFTKDPGTTDDNVFNEQQTYYWAQVLKTKVDEWGREKNDYGHYPVDADRALNVEIVVNGDSAMEVYWDSNAMTDPVSNPSGVCMHGYCNTRAEKSWFLDHPGAGDTVPAVFLFNSAGNSASPQLVGPEYSGSYSIIAHEVGHFISWQYGGWRGPVGTNFGSSLNEGHSMVMAALMGKQRWPSMDYTDSDYVTTGSPTSGFQWSYHPIGSATLKYTSMDAQNPNTYYTAWPFVQAMWQLMNNKDMNGSKIWKTDDAAISNTADLFMYSLYTYTEDSTMTWDKLVFDLLIYMHERIVHGLEKKPLKGFDSWCAAYNVFKDFDLLSKCVNSA